MARNIIRRAAAGLASRYETRASEDARRAVGASESSIRHSNYGSRVPGRAGAMIRETGRMQADESRKHADSARRNARRSRAASRFAR